MKAIWKAMIGVGAAIASAGCAFGIVVGVQASDGMTAAEWAKEDIESRYPICEYSLVEAKATEEATKGAFAFDAWIWNGDSAWHEHIRVKVSPNRRKNAYAAVRRWSDDAKWYAEEIDVTAGWGW